MKSCLITNDTHIGVKRTAGTTPATAYALRKWVLEELRTLVLQHTDKVLISNGDLFDGYLVPVADVLEAYHIFAEWLERAQEDLILVRGNHDISKDSSQVSSLEFLATILQRQFGERVHYVTEPTFFKPLNMLVIPHLLNQELFDKALEESSVFNGSYILVHANYDNNFCVESDHSLGVSEAQAVKITDNNNILFFGHEHQARKMLGGKVFIAGNQTPTSVADCLGNPKMQKHAHVIDDSGITPIVTWDGNTGYIDVDWQELALTDLDGYQFIRVSGKAHPEEAAESLAVISKLRQKSDAFVITNAVSVVGQEGMDDIIVSVDQIKQFDVLDYLFEQLEPEQVAKIKSLMEQS